MSTIAGQLSLEAANTAFLAKADEVFSGAPEGPWAMLTEVVPCDGQTLEIDAMGPTPAVLEIVGSRRFGSLRAYARREAVKNYGPPALEFSRLQIEKDKTGLLNRRLQNYVSSVGQFWDKPVMDKFLANPTGLDGVALLSASHPYASGGGTWDNKVEEGLSPSAFATGIAAMASLLLENGEPGGFYPTHLIVGPSNQKLAFDLCQNAQRVVPISASGVEAYSSALAAASVPNWIAGQITPVISSRMVGTYASGWLLMDLSRAGVRPMILGEAIAPSAFIANEPGSEPMLQRSSIAYYIEGYGAPGGFLPHCIYGSMTGS